MSLDILKIISRLHNELPMETIISFSSMRESFPLGLFEISTKRCELKYLVDTQILAKSDDAEERVVTGIHQELEMKLKNEKSKHILEITGSMQVEIDSFKRVFDKIDNPILGVVQAHLFWEQYLLRYFQCILPKPSSFKKLGLGFYKQLCIAKSLADIDAQILDGLYKLNELRNDCAHNFDFEINQDRVVQLGRTLGKQFGVIKKENPQSPTVWLAHSLAFLCGAFAGWVFAMEQEKSFER